MRLSICFYGLTPPMTKLVPIYIGVIAVSLARLSLLESGER